MTSAADPVICLFLLAGLLTMSDAAANAAPLPRLTVSENGRFLVTEDGEPFFYLADTAWELFHRLDREEAERYLADRAAKGFTVIQAVVLAEYDGLRTPNANGDVPLIDLDPTKPNEAYFEHVDAVVDIAERLGLRIGMLPTWGDKWLKKWGVGPVIFTPENAEAYGEYVGRRYRDKPIIWILGGDRYPETDEHLAITRAMARGLRRGDGGRHLMTFHPSGGVGSSRWFHGDDWLDFNMIQSGHHQRPSRNYELIAADYARTPVKPCMDGEPLYDDLPVKFDPANGWFGEDDVRAAAYWSVFAGSHGHTYGCNDIWQMYAPGRSGVVHARTFWYDAIDLPAAAQMGHLRALMESRPFFSRIPDQGLVIPGGGTEPDLVHLVYTRDVEGSALLYRDGETVARASVGGAMTNWDGAFRLALANELTGDRPWLGEFRRVAVYAQALTPLEVGALLDGGAEHAPAGALVLYDFGEGVADVVRDTSGSGEPLDLRISDPSAVAWVEGGGLAVRAPVLIASAGPATKVTDAVARSGAVTVEAWVRPANLDQAGPARIVTVSADTGRRNLTLGQDGGAFVMRLRTTETSDNGLPPLTSAGGAPGRVAATRDSGGAYAMVYVPEPERSVTVDTSALSGERLNAWWHDPRTGKAEPIEGDFAPGGPLRFTTPANGPDWVLVLDDAAQAFPPPGSRPRIAAAGAER